MPKTGKRTNNVKVTLSVNPLVVALAKDWSSYADTGYSVYMDDSDTPIHECNYKDGKAMLGY